MRKIFFLIALATLAACENTTVTSSKTIEVTNTKTNTGLDIAGLHQADSVQILFFTDPFGKDSLRYTRFFKHYNTSEDSTVQPLLKNLDQLFLLRTEVMKCRSEGKIFFFKGTQELKTVYFSTQANGDCAYMYFIKDGGFYYFQIQPATAALLRKIKPKAVQPSAEN